ncbi:CHK kinase-like domain-containing protein [Caenorhabditis elegans]|uniref:CHK kinase-like domain-containing protein n=1 Tax=Caenorhabditis elegans TaxID=6239 RepID=Q9XUP2_CAEEL|nr:CHK kinase-like domain-containing protein [Caenorhabditis elegans]CAB04733.2 CHK kinase-like domain-containing protein [Caenorhabditis elegans]|eukprot:NP_506234.2 Uncharacterized protein CELE_T16G1.6 [Caenorhabditis elegans]
MTAEKLTILDNGEGLFQTHVYVKDVQEAIGEQMNTESRLGENTKYTVVGDGNGFMSRVVLVEPEWTITENHLPKKFILKICSSLHVHGIVDKMKESNQSINENEEELWAMFENEAQHLHNREVNFYVLAEKWNKPEELLNAKIFFSKKFDSENKLKGFLGMEYVDDVTIRHLYCNLKPYELHPVLKAVAQLQAESLHLSDEELQSISGFDFKQMMGTMFNDDGLKGNYKQTRDINPERLKEKTDIVEAFGMEVVNFEFAGNLNKVVGIHKDVLVHGDLWAANILWNENDGKFSASKVIDYQIIHMGNPAEDLVRVFLCTLSGADRQAHWEKLLEQFYEYFLEALEDNEIPYTLDQLKESYRLYFVTGSLVMLPLYGPIAQTKLSYSKDTEHVEEYREILTEKAEKLLEDMEHWHFYSRNLTGRQEKDSVTN